MKQPTTIPASYRRDYERGWRYSARETATLDHLDADPFASEAVYDGYLDYAAGREKWHLYWCRQDHFVGCSEHGPRE